MFGRNILHQMKMMKRTEGGRSVWRGNISDAIASGEAVTGIGMAMADVIGDFEKVINLNAGVDTAALESLLRNSTDKVCVVLDYCAHTVRVKPSGGLFIEETFTTDGSEELPMPSKKQAIERVKRDVRARYTEAELGEAIAATERIEGRDGEVATALLREIAGLEKAG